MTVFLNLSARQFVPLSNLKERRAALLKHGKQVKGAVLLTPEGIDFAIAGEAEPVEALLGELRGWPGLQDLQPQISGSQRMPFRRLQVRVKQAIGRPPRAPHAEQWTQCGKCRTPLDGADRAHPHFKLDQSCAYCFKTPADAMAATLEKRHAHLERIITPLPGSVPRDHFRPVSVPASCDGLTLIEALFRIVPHIPEAQWRARCAEGFLVDGDGNPVATSRIVRGGERYFHKFPGLIEPDVDMRVQVLYEDESIVVVNKPAPLPMHAAGRFYRNTLKYVLDALYHPQSPRPAHRLDANTTGVVVASRTQFVAGKIQPQFARGEVEKVYLVRAQGQPNWETHRCEARISAVAGHIGSRVIDEENGLDARTDFKVLERNADGTSLLEARPFTGRTNQIRVHLWHLGHPIYGDPAYLSGRQLGDTQTLGIDAPPLCLHAWRLTFLHPLVKERMTFEAPPPAWAAFHAPA